MDIFTTAPTLSPTEAPKMVYITLNGTAVEFTDLRDAIDRAIAGNPQVLKARTSVGVEIRMVIDRLGEPVRAN